MARRTTDERFWSKVQGGDYTECWTWTGTRNDCGYGQFFIGMRDGKIKRVKAHRYAYDRLRFEILGSPYPHLDHLCDNPPCVNPWHLEPVDRQTNTLRAIERGRWRGAYTTVEEVANSRYAKGWPAKYRAAFDDLRRRHASGEWAPGDELPVWEIGNRLRYDVANSSIRRALMQLLVSDGWVEERDGKWYVKERT